MSGKTAVATEAVWRRILKLTAPIGRPDDSAAEAETVGPQPIHCVILLAIDHEDGSPHESVEQDGSGLTLPLPAYAICELDVENYHVVSLTADGKTVPPQAAGDLWRRIRAHNESLPEVV